MPFNLVFTYKLHYIFGVFSKMPESNTEKKNDGMIFTKRSKFGRQGDV